ncbi:hypothetical protein KIPB_001478 [Kipferlia bialata]|uniref:Uncharacterized protein n=1 Tax=Kipferlia bialata TaxID=797122 RepID=A0A9K3CQP2_9EUKA|nr:hypothetical protein KIPB_001478 [Kipferlia bialata]|eukprot:g1478.t1
MRQAEREREGEAHGVRERERETADPVLEAERAKEAERQRRVRYLQRNDRKKVQRRAATAKARGRTRGKPRPAWARTEQGNRAAEEDAVDQLLAFADGLPSDDEATAAAPGDDTKTPDAMGELVQELLGDTSLVDALTRAKERLDRIVALARVKYEGQGNLGANPFEEGAEGEREGEGEGEGKDIYDTHEVFKFKDGSSLLRYLMQQLPGHSEQSLRAMIAKERQEEKEREKEREREAERQREIAAILAKDKESKREGEKGAEGAMPHIDAPMAMDAVGKRIPHPTRTETGGRRIPEGEVFCVPPADPEDVPTHTRKEVNVHTLPYRFRNAAL